MVGQSCCLPADAQRRYKCSSCREKIHSANLATFFVGRGLLWDGHSIGAQIPEVVNREGQSLLLYNRHDELYSMWRADEVKINGQMSYELHGREFDIPLPHSRKKFRRPAGLRYLPIVVRGAYVARDKVCT